MTTAQVAAAAKAPPNRMKLSSVVRGVAEKPKRVLLYGVEGVGKSSFAAAAPSPIFVCPEDGLTHIDVPRFPEPETWLDVRQAVETLRTEKHEFKTLVFDTLDWLEPMLWRFVCDRDKQPDIESYGYGKGYATALDEWRVFVAQLETLRRERRIEIILLAHSWIKPFKNPEGEDFDRYEMKLHAKAGGFLREWCDAVLFANYETFATKDKNKRVRGVSTGARLIFTERSAAYDAKNRYNLPPQLPLDYAAFSEAILANRPAEPAVIKARITELLEGATPELRKMVEDTIATNPDDAAFLARVLNRLAANVSAKEIAQ